MIHVASMVKDESERYWRSALDSWSDFADSFFILDDFSTDNTLQIAMEYDETIPVEMDEQQSSAWGNEAIYRKRLFNFATDLAEVGDTIIWLDADMAPLQNPRQYLLHTDATIFLFRLFDFWSTSETDRIGQRAREQYDYRDEPPFWVAHKNPRPWAIRVTEEVKERDFEWSERGIHCGHLPNGLFKLDHTPVLAPKELSLGHWSYFHEQDRERKFRRYQSVQDQLTDFEWKHAQTIVEPHPKLSKLEIEVEYPLKRADE